MKRPLLSDDMVDMKLASLEKLQYRLELTGPIMFWKAEVIGPFGSEFFGRSATAPASDKAVERLKAQLARNGFIGLLIESPIIGKDYSDDDLLSDEEVPDEL